jgi:MFS family permease
MPTPSTRSLRALDWLNVFLADVRGGVGPYLAIYLMVSRHWDPASIGVAMAAMGMATVIAQTPAGALVDSLAQKRLLAVLAALCVGIGCVATTLLINFYAVVSVQMLAGIAEAIFPPAIAAISLGMVGHGHLAIRVGRNETFNHAGNVAAALLAGLLGYFVALCGVFYLVAVFAAASIASVLWIKPDDIDQRLARGATPQGAANGSPSSLAAVLTDRRIATFALTVVLFHFANAAMLPLAGELLSVGKPAGSSLYMSACIIAAQLVMVPVAALAGRGAEQWGRKPIFLIGFAVLPVRGLLYTLSSDPFFIVSVQLLDGIGAGIFGVLGVLMVADLTKGTGRFNITQGAIATAQGIGAALSNLAAGYVVNAAGYSAAFAGLAGIAGIAFILFYLAVPETKEALEVEHREEAFAVATARGVTAWIR